jgi:hypothetical protein
VIVVHAGNRVDDARRATPRFPAHQVAHVGDRLGRLLRELRPRLVVTAAAAGADLLVMEEALRVPGVAVHVVLPFDRETFRRESVEDRGDEWTARYDRLVDELAARDDCKVFEHGGEPGAGAYDEGNRQLVDHARSRAAADEGVLALAVRPKAPADPPSVTDRFVERARTAGLTVIDIDPGITPEDMDQAFVAMPFGTKHFQDRDVDCDATFGKVIVPVLEDADLRWERADQDPHTGMIHVGMIEQLANADVVVVDTIADNANVAYELGIRHALADRTTVLIGPEGSRAPFDLGSIRHFRYRLTGSEVSDRDALDAVGRLRAVLRAAVADDACCDSPVFELFDPPRTTLKVRSDRGEAPQMVIDLDRRVTTAARCGSIDDLTTLATDVRHAAISDEQRRQLLLRIGTALRHAGDHDAAVSTLEALEHDPTDTQHLLWSQQLAMGMRRQGEAAAAAGGDPEPLWRRAQGILDRVLEETGDDAETCGIAGGLEKRRGVRALHDGNRSMGRAHLERATAYYRRGVDADPGDFYTGLNAVVLGRLLSQRLGGDPSHGEAARQLLPVVRFLAERAARRAPDDFWAVVTVAELGLTAHLFDPGLGPDESEVGYARAFALRPTHDQVASVRDQLALYEVAGDPPELLDRVRALFGR